MAKILDPRFTNDGLANVEFLRKHVNLPTPVPPQTSEEREGSSLTSRLYLIDQIMDEHEAEFQVAPHDELHAFLTSTANGDRSIDPLHWWKLNRQRFPILAMLARNILSVQPSSVASERAFSISGHVVSDLRSSMCDHSITDFVLLKCWQMH